MIAQYRKMATDLARARAALRRAGAPDPDALNYSTRAGKRFMWRNPETGRLTHFGSDSRNTHLDSPDEKKRRAYVARHAPGGFPRYTPAWLALKVLWT